MIILRYENHKILIRHIYVYDCAPVYIWEIETLEYTTFCDIAKTESKPSNHAVAYDGLHILHRINGHH